jgi:hypothetical protein
MKTYEQSIGMNWAMCEPKYSVLPGAKQEAEMRAEADIKATIKHLRYHRRCQGSCPSKEGIHHCGHGVQR